MPARHARAARPAKPCPADAIACPSPNCGPRRDGLLPRLVVIHFTGMGDLDAALERLCAPEHEVSAHYLIARDGRLFQLVAEDQRAWHAGRGSWGGLDDINSRSIGIELDNTGATPFPAPLMDRLEALLSGLLDRWSIPPEGVIGHQDFAPTRKWDPGPRFDWRRLARAGLAVWPEGPPEKPMTVDRPEEAAFLTAAEVFGYPVEAGLAVVLAAFRARFRPWAAGPLDIADIAAVTDLATRFPAVFPVDRTAPNA